MNLLTIIERTGLALLIIAFILRICVSQELFPDMSSNVHEYLGLIGLATWAMAYGVRKVEERKKAGE